MKTYYLSRRHFLQTAIVTGAAGMVSTFPGVSISATGRTLTIRLDGEPDSFDPGYYTGGSPVTDINWCVMPSLVRYGDSDQGWVPSDYVESFTVRDAKNIDFTLKKGMMWSGGYGELTTADVAFSYDRMAESEWKGDYVAYDRMEVKDDYTATIVLNQPFAPFVGSTLASGTGIILCRKAVEDAGGKFTLDIPATCGPYVYEIRQGQYAKLTRNPDWSGPTPAYDTINGLVITEPDAAVLAYEAGELDCTEIAANSYARLLKELPEDSAFSVAGALQYMWMGINTEHPKLKDVRVRQAIQHAVDRDSIIQGAFSGAVEPSHGIVCPGLLGKRDTSSYSYDPAKAKSLLEDAGVSNLSLVLRVLSEQDRLLTAQIIQANLEAVGISVKVLPLDEGPFWDMGQESKGETWKELELWIMTYGAGTDPYEPFQWFLRDQIGVWNWERWSSDEFEELFAKGVAETDPVKRHGIYIRMQEIMEETGGYVWLVHELDVFLHRASLDTLFAPSGEALLSYFRPE